MKINIILIFFVGIILISSGITITFAQEWTDYNTHDPGITTTQAIPEWVKTTMTFYLDEQISEREILDAFNYLFENNIMHLSQKAAQEVQDMRDEIDDLKLELEETKAAIAIPNLIEARKGANESSASSETGERIMQPEYGAVDEPQTEVEIRGWDYEQKESSTSEANKEAVQRFVIELYSEIDFTSETVDDILRKGGTESKWNEGITTFSQHGLRESVMPELQSIVVLCSIEIDKETQQIDAELEMIEQWLEIISEKQKNVDSYDESGRLASTTETNSQYNQSDLDFITRKLSSIDQQIKALDTGVGVLEEKLQSMGEDAQLANIDLQNKLQKQQQTLQTMSNVSKAAHDTAMSIIRKIG